MASAGSVIDIEIMISCSLPHAEIERDCDGFLAVHLIQLVAHLIIFCADNYVQSHQGVEFLQINTLLLQFTMYLIAVDSELVSISILSKFWNMHITKVVINMDLINTEWVLKI